VAQAALLRELAAVLGLRQEAASTAGPAEAGASDAGPGDAEIEALIKARKAAKASRDFARADRIRDGLRAQGIELIDRPGGITEWLRR
jgi:cysteinyl-tRNA synthetase